MIVKMVPEFVSPEELQAEYWDCRQVRVTHDKEGVVLRFPVDNIPDQHIPFELEPTIYIMNDNGKTIDKMSFAPGPEA